MNYRFWQRVMILSLLASGLTPFMAQAETGENQEKIQQLETGEIDTADAAWWGFDENDATDALQAAIHSGARHVIVPDMGAPWIVRETIHLASNQTVTFEDGVVVEAMAGKFHGRYDFLFAAVETENLKLIGHGATFRMRKQDYQSDAYERSSWRHGIGLYSTRDIVIEGVTVESSGGDGIYLGISGWHGTPSTEDRPLYSQNIVIREVTCRDNHRQGISVISVRGLLIEDTILENTRGTPPQAGIDFEPFRDDQVLQDVVMRNCLTRNNAGGGYMIWLPYMTEPVSIRLENCRSEGDREGLRVRTDSAAQRHLAGVIEVVDCVFENSRARGIAIEKSASQPTVHLVNTQVINPALDHEDRRPIMFHSSAGATDPVGGVTFENLLLNDPLNRTPIGYTDFAGGLPLEDITGTLHLTADERKQTVELTQELIDEWTGTGEWVDVPRLSLDDLDLHPVEESEGWTEAEALDGARIRGRQSQFVVYAREGETVVLGLDHARLGGGQAPPLQLQVLDPTDDVVSEAEVPIDTQIQLEFVANTTGIYRVQPDRVRHTLALTHSSHLANLALGDDRLNLKRPEGEFYLWIPRGTAEFTVEVSGEGSREAVKATLINPEGKEIYHADDAVAVQQFAVEYPGPAPSRGEAWVLRLERPSTSSLHFGDVHIDIRGVPPVLAPSRETLLHPRD
ncbi:right-handed parallel beta-helix repeat-containing protein [Phycisphaerales bacterium AB-hyl4]|uniref:Right-handed parallel beta-helix repeat-containing protein n=1 Tax=Natronomicrosphaera hydrolytica TaxID=3242702 RepID=A0ABV4U054_9BACT